MKTSSPRVDEVLKHTVGPTILDIGCSGQAGRRSAFTSDNWLHGRLLADFPNACGLEYSADNIAALEAAGIANVYEGDAQDFELGQTFDTIIAGEIIEHLANVGDFLDTSRRHLAPGGRLIVTTPYPFNIFFVLYAWLRFPHTCSNDEHVMWFCPSTINTVAKGHGFRIVENTLVADYRRDLASRIGRIIGYFGRALRRVLPIRLVGTNMVVVMVPE